MALTIKTNYTSDFDILDARKIGELKKVRTGPSFVDPNRIRRSNVYAFFSGNKEYDFTEAYRIADTESFVSSALSKKKNLILKDGYNLVSENEDDVLYIAKRLNELAYVTDVPFTTLLEDILFDVPDKMPEGEIKITGEMVHQKLDSIVKNRDLSKYIL